MSTPSLSSNSRKKPRLETALSLQNLHARLQDAGESNMEDLLAFKKFLDAITTEASTDYVPTIAAANLTRAQVFTYFKFKNTIINRWGLLAFDIPPFKLQAKFRVFENTPSDWLTHALDLWGVSFRQNNEANIHTFINMIIMRIMRDMQRFQADGSPNSDPRAKASAGRPSAPTLVSSNKVLCVFNDVQVSNTLQVHDKQIRIVGQFDIGFGYGATFGDLPAGTTPSGRGVIDSYLAVLETKGVCCGLESAFNQLLVYLAMVQRARLEKFKRSHTGNGICIVYGVLSHGNTFLFICLDNNSIVYRSKEFDTRNNLLDILHYLRYCLVFVATSSPISPPSYIRMAALAKQESGTSVETPLAKEPDVGLANQSK